MLAGLPFCLGNLYLKYQVALSMLLAVEAFVRARRFYLDGCQQPASMPKRFRLRRNHHSAFFNNSRSFFPGYTASQQGSAASAQKLGAARV